MPLLDDRGRLFGRINLIDAAVAAFVLFLIPLAYGAYVLFRAPAPVVTTVEPRTITTPKGKLIEIKGQHLRPFFRAYLGATVGEYLFISPDRSEIRLPDLAPGSYEVILYDEAQEVARGGSISVQPTARVSDDTIASLTVVGSFNRLEPSQVAALKPGVTMTPLVDAASPLPDSLEIVAVQPPAQSTIPLYENPTAPLVELAGRQQVMAVVRLQGRLIGKEIQFTDRRVVPGAELVLPQEPGPAPKKFVSFVVHKTYLARPTLIDVRVRFVSRPEIVAVVQRDVSLSGRSADPFRSLGPQILSLNVTSELVGETKADLREGRLSIVEAVVRIPAGRTAEGWSFENKPIRPGAELFLETPTWQMTGVILNMEGRNALAGR